ncbi:hypothetical protein FH972_023711 [Carpinus fangiana]|uniref:dihydrofolate reductase n=1 Tax=Carpinus fangiana TaxID=176857 RepID=A0A5N6KVZ4_9ROSI|nr:hypothetical protein FH972_023711 [Carpinus fangiana]
MTTAPPPTTLPMKPLTLIVAATRTMGIGNKGTLPWPLLKHEMAYFARTTKRAPPGADPAAQNAVIMGRRTWDSIPAKFRPLTGRLNVVLSRAPGLQAQVGDAALVESSLAAALRRLDELDAQGRVGRVFVIGGGSVYAEALGEGAARATRVLLTRVKTEFECDTRFPLDVESRAAKALGWERCAQDELDGFVGESVDSGDRSEGGVDYEFTLYKRRG